MKCTLEFEFDGEESELDWMPIQEAVMHQGGFDIDITTEDD